jgi:hypothetical protein
MLVLMTMASILVRRGPALPPLLPSGQPKSVDLAVVLSWLAMPSTSSLRVASAALLLTACGANLQQSDLNERERAITVYAVGAQPQCAYDNLGIIEAVSGGPFEAGTYESTVAMLQQEAARRGASALVIQTHIKSGKDYKGTAHAIRCRAQAAPPPGAPMPAPQPAPVPQPGAMK